MMKQASRALYGVNRKKTCVESNPELDLKTANMSSASAKAVLA